MVTCRIFKVFDWTMPQQSASLMLLIAYDRLRLVSLGVDYNTKETRKIVLRRIIIAWVFTIVFFVPIQFVDLMFPEEPVPLVQNSLPDPRYILPLPLSYDGFCQTELFFSKPVSTIWLIVGNFVTPLCTVFIYGLVFFRIRQRKNLLFTKVTSLMEQQDYVCNIFQQTKQLTEYAHFVRATRRMMILTTVFLVTWLPCGITPFVLDALYGSSWVCRSDSCDEKLNGIHTITVYLMYTNSVINPMMYALNFPKIRTALKETFPGCRPCHVRDNQDELEQPPGPIARLRIVEMNVDFYSAALSSRD